MTPYETCLQTVPFRKGERWVYKSGFDAQRVEHIEVLIEGIDFAVTEHLGVQCQVYGRYLGNEATSGIVRLFCDRFVSKVEEEAA